MTCFTKWKRYFVVGELATTNEEVVRIAGLLRGTESAVQAVSVSLPFRNIRPLYLMTIVWPK
jgi:hypothetical protein